MSTKLDLYIIAFKMYDLQILFIALLEIQLLTGDGQSVQVGLLLALLAATARYLHTWTGSAHLQPPTAHSR